MIELDNIHSYCGTSHVLQGIDMTVESGEVVSLLGRNGPGTGFSLEGSFFFMTDK